METPIIHVERLNLRYGRVQALTSVSIDIYPRQIQAIIGPSGCGKSTFLRTLNRMNDRVPGLVVEGQVIIDGKDIYDASVDVVDLRRRVGMVFQKPVAFPMSVFDNVAYGPRLHRLANNPAALRDIVEDSLRQAGVWDEVKDRLHQPAAQLSGGQLQRVAIARALAVSPEVILLDEPTSAIDPVGTMHIEETLLQLSRHYTIVIVTHNMDQAGRISDRTAFFLSGRLVEEGPTSELFQRPKDPRTEAYLTGRFGQA